MEISKILSFLFSPYSINSSSMLQSNKILQIVTILLMLATDKILMTADHQLSSTSSSSLPSEWQPLLKTKNITR